MFFSYFITKKYYYIFNTNVMETQYIDRILWMQNNSKVIIQSYTPSVLILSLLAVVSGAAATVTGGLVTAIPVVGTAIAEGTTAIELAAAVVFTHRKMLINPADY